MMSIKSILSFLVGLLILQSCSTSKNKTMWVAGYQTECDNDPCLIVNENESLDEEEWKTMKTPIEEFKFEAGKMKQIEVSKEKDQSNYTFVKTISSQIDPRIKLNGNWILATINGGNINKMVSVPTLKIDISAMQFSGNGGCNLYQNEIEHLGTQYIKLKNGLGTLKECANENIERDYFSTLSKIAQYKIEEGKLLFLNADEKVILSFIKVKTTSFNTALRGEWKTVEIEGNQIEGSQTPTFVVDEQKRMIGGTDGCNNYNATIESFSNVDLNLSKMMSTKKMCANMEIPKQFLAAMHKVSKYKIQDGQLILMDNNSKVLLKFEK
ncbi:hypothetical protein CW751_13890 [Brumimicrobium salinarum]|uniref:DUF306 domain-containing protein n=1 Tax=Brumimicrobium salinarum TaxID=2058658 RepID=A0A2I0QZ99_9FLAO|nr:META domain-containing protein [Brumimicrobium salinarum]PKR79656.1 hypothetical protein CW751_13890 [Brumimicrobium salinarum]